MGYKDYRKIVRIGQNSYGIILPISWIRYNNLVHGDNVELISDSGNEITVRPTQRDGEEER